MKPLTWGCVFFAVICALMGDDAWILFLIVAMLLETEVMA